MGSSRGRMSGRSPSLVAISYRDRASSSSSLLPSPSPETVSEGDGDRGTPSMACWRRRFFNASAFLALRIARFLAVSLACFFWEACRRRASRAGRSSGTGGRVSRNADKSYTPASTTSAKSTEKQE
jgi:hypothetical protein